MSLYELETRSYQDVAPLVPDLALAHCHLAKLADNATDFTLVSRISALSRPRVTP